MSHRTFDFAKTGFVSALRFVVTKKANSTFMASSTAFISVHSCAGVAQGPPLLGDRRLYIWVVPYIWSSETGASGAASSPGTTVVLLGEFNPVSTWAYVFCTRQQLLRVICLRLLTLSKTRLMTTLLTCLFRREMGTIVSSLPTVGLFISLPSLMVALHAANGNTGFVYSFCNTLIFFSSNSCVGTLSDHVHILLGPDMHSWGVLQ